MASITIRRPDDWHVHFRDGAVLRTVVPFTARRFGRAIVMPNLTPPVTTAAMAVAYRERVLAAVPADARFTPLMTCYLTDATDPADLVAGHRAGDLDAVLAFQRDVGEAGGLQLAGRHRRQAVVGERIDRLTETHAGRDGIMILLQYETARRLKL